MIPLGETVKVKLAMSKKEANVFLCRPVAKSDVQQVAECIYMSRSGSFVPFACLSVLERTQKLLQVIGRQDWTAQCCADCLPLTKRGYKEVSVT